MRTDLATRLEALAPLLGSAFAFFVFGWRW
jgi:hypothetical protein